MDKEKKSELKHAYNILCRHNLWRQGHTDRMPEPEEITKSISAACGALIDFVAVSKELKTVSQCLAIAEKELEIKDNREEALYEIIDKTLAERNSFETEVKRLRGLLAANGIKYKKK